MIKSIHGVEILGEITPHYEEILTEDAIVFIRDLHRMFNKQRKQLLQKRKDLQEEINQGKKLNFLENKAAIRDINWVVAPIPADLQDRRTEITGPVDRRMVINALNSGAKVFMADFEDANTPSWHNLLDGQINLRDAIRKQIDFTADNGKNYALKEFVAVLKVRPRGWHMEENHVFIDGAPISASIFDFGLYFFHNAWELVKRGSGPYFYLPKIESHLEAQLWNDIFIAAQEAIEMPRATIKATVLIETITAAFEMDEILYVLREHIAGLNAGRWDYIFSCIKKFHRFSDCILPDRSQVTMSVPFMRAYAKLLVKTCHKRKAHAIGGMSAYIPSRKDESINKLAFEKVNADKELEASTGFDGTWVAHPDLVPVALQPFNKVLRENPHQKHILLENENITAEELTNFSIPDACITEAGIRMNIQVGILYIESWLRGIGAAAIHNLMEDAATAEISRAQLWQWLHHRAKTYYGVTIDISMYKFFLADEIQKIKDMVGEDNYFNGRFFDAINLFDKLVTQKKFDLFLTTEAYSTLLSTEEVEI
ncbi:malate synthase A [Arcicella sp. LKC2W]|uniref:malate synthase A n=1 Tax=Arcicella sp. LKC2W TaxID=2984198 RepID=UPI002B1F9E79|nr:malate synthase A [Arcicella sp. LKC2W]MEA5458870.1 malate synthase A [Arcicella sp. LKC2W]